jgi:hypothetical protein
MDVFKKDWEEWMDHNISLGNCKNIMFENPLFVAAADLTLLSK